MNRESSQTMWPVAVPEICSYHLVSFVSGAADNMLKQHTCLGGPAPLLGLREATLPQPGHAGRKGRFGPHQGSPLPRVQVSSPFILSDAQNAEHRRVCHNVA